MVQKKGKHGIATGNTLRAINSKYIRRYRREANIVLRDPLVRQISHTEISSTEVFEGCGDVLYSLNKRMRWLLPDLIRNAFRQYNHEYQANNLYQNTRHHDFTTFIGYDHDVQLPENLELVERYKLTRNNNGRNIDAFTSNPKDNNKSCSAKAKQKNKHYIDADNVMKTTSVFSRNTRRLQFLREYVDEETITDKKECLNEITNDEDNCTSDTVRLEVLYPCTHTSVLSIKPKRLGNETRKKFEHSRGPRSGTNLYGYQFRRRPNKNYRDNIQEVIKGGLDEYLDAVDSYDFEDNTCDTYSPQKRQEAIREDNVKVHSQIEDKPRKESRDNSPDTAKQAESKLKQSDSNDADDNEPKTNVDISPFKDSGEDCNVNTDDGRSTYFDDEDSEVSAKTCESIPISVILRKDEVDVNALEQRYGDDSVECNCIPRRFAISISEFICDLDVDGVGPAYKLLPILNKKMFSWLIFSRDPKNKLNSADEEVFKVRLNAHFKELAGDIKIVGILENSVVSVSEIIGASLKTLKGVPRETLIFENRSGNGRNPSELNKKSILEEMKSWTNIVYFPDNFYIISSLTNSKDGVHPQLDTDPVSDNIKWNVSDTSNECKICLSRKSTKTALMFCSHYFCNTCWMSYIQTKVNTGCCVILCPEVECDVRVDNGTIISFLSVKDIRLYALLRHNISIENNELARWCSNESCGRVIKVNKSDVRTTTCTCGETMCFACGGRPHWPLSCAQYQDYVNILVKTRDKDITPQDFVLKFDKKFCKLCYKIVARYDKCYLANCSCERMACLRCSFLWHTRQTTSEKNIPEMSMCSKLSTVLSLDLIKQRSFLSGGLRTQWYKLALKHRLNQHPFRLAKIHANSKLLAKRIEHYILLEEKKCHFVYLDMLLTEDSYLREADKATLFMTQIVKLYGDINNIIESCAFFLDTEGITDQKADSLHRRVMILSTCANTVCNVVKDAAFLNPKSVIDRLRETYSEVRRVMESIVKDF